MRALILTLLASVALAADPPAQTNTIMPVPCQPGTELELAPPQVLSPLFCLCTPAETWRCETPTPTEEEK